MDKITNIKRHVENRGDICHFCFAPGFCRRQAMGGGFLLIIKDPQVPLARVTPEPGLPLSSTAPGNRLSDTHSRRREV